MVDMQMPRAETQLPEPVFADVPFEQSGWQSIVAVLERVNRAKAQLLVSLYEAEVRVAFNAYGRIRQEEALRLEELRAQLREVEAHMEPLLQRWQAQHDALREQLYPAWLDAYTQAAQAGINLHGDPLGEGAEFTEHTDQASSDSQSIPPAASTAPSVGQNPPNSQPTPPPLTPAEVIHEKDLPSYEGTLIPLPLWAVLIIVVGMGMGLMLALSVGLVAPNQPLNEALMLPLALLGGIGLTYLWTRALWGATAIVAELYHLFSWHEAKAWRAARSIAAAAIALVLLIVPVAWVVMSLASVASAQLQSLVLVMPFTVLLLVPLLACAMLEGFLEGRRKPIGHLIAAHITQYEREQFRANPDANRSTGESPDSKPSDPVDGDDSKPSDGTQEAGATQGEIHQAAWVAIRRYQALLRQYQHLKQEMEQDLQLRLHREQREQLKAEMEQSRRRILSAYHRWAQRYQFFLQCLADALRECQGGDELMGVVQAHLQQIQGENR